MLDDARGEPLELEPDGAPVTSWPSTVTSSAPLDRHAHALQRQAALLVDVSSHRALRRSGVDERRHVLVVGGWKTKSRRRTPTCVAASPTPCASCISVRHPLGEPRELVVEVLDLVRPHPQDGVAVLADLGQREPATRRAPRASSCSLVDLARLALGLPGCSRPSRHIGRECSSERLRVDVDDRRQPARRIAGAAAASRRRRAACERARAVASSPRAARGGGRAGAAAAPGRAARRRRRRARRAARGAAARARSASGPGRERSRRGGGTAGSRARARRSSSPARKPATSCRAA